MQTTCPSCSASIDLSQGHCSACGFQFGNIASAPMAAVRRPRSQADLLLANLVDGTGSSLLFAAGILQIIKLVPEAIAPRVRSLAISTLVYGDLECGEDMILITDRGTPDQAVADSTRINFSGGGDAAETQLDGLEHLINTIPWHRDGRRGRNAVLWFSTADTKPTRSKATPQDLGRHIRERNILLYMVADPRPFHDDIAKECDALIFPISNNPDPADIQKIAGKLSASITGTIASCGTVPMSAIA